MQVRRIAYPLIGSTYDSIGAGPVADVLSVPRWVTRCQDYLMTPCALSVAMMLSFWSPRVPPFLDRIFLISSAPYSLE